MSIAGGVHRALERGRSISCQAVQIFTRNQLRWSAPSLGEEEIRAFHRLRGQFAQVLAHASYLINLASPDEQIYRRSIAALEEEMRRCRTLGIPVLVLHPGFHRGRGIGWGIKRLAEGVRAAFRSEGTEGVLLALETTAGYGSSLGGSFEQLRDLLCALQGGGPRSGVCFDTCHVFAAGYELRDRRGYDRTWDAFDAVIGRDHLVALHLNDSRGMLGSGKDRHEHIGKGRIGVGGFRLLVRDTRLNDLPGILETPKGPGMEEDVENLRLLRSLARPEGRLRTRSFGQSLNAPE
jgi:deoxyribonuclease-4